MEKTRRKSSASEFFSRRHSSSLFQSMRRYSTSTIFGAGSRSDTNGDSGGDIVTRKNGRRHSTAQLPISNNSLNNSSPITTSRTEKIKSLAKVVLGDVEEQQEQDCVDDLSGRDKNLFGISLQYFQNIYNSSMHRL